ncbi:MAG: DNA-3-methyladenine glycosylase 2 family protein [Phycisphaerae bacterium]|nr:DNA-3-methyladenine glycosylase 2 family protein [Phycisphaerae bacterium]
MSSNAKHDGFDLVQQRRRNALAAVRHLRRADQRLGQLITHIGPHTPIITRDPFIALIGSIVQQQVSMSAATAIYKRLKGLCPRNRLTSRSILALDEDALRGVGLSRQKSAYVRNIASAFASRTLNAAKLRRMSDEEVIDATTCIKGVGRWTAEMLLIFCLERPDVWPVDDLGLKKAVRNFMNWDELPAAGSMNELAEPWRPYRTYATWYLWRGLEGPLMPGVAL